MNNFIKASIIRAIRTICQTAVAVIGTALTSVATGLPEVEYFEHQHMSVDEPDDAEVNENEEC